MFAFAHRRLPHAARARRARPAGAEAAGLRARRDRLCLRIDGAQRAAVAAARPAELSRRRDRRLPRASLHPGAAHDLRGHRARLPNASPHRACVSHGRLVAFSLLGAAAPADADCGALLDDRSSCGSSPIVRSALFLSGGVDSGDDCMPACRDRTFGTCASFSAAFPGSPLDESADAAATARALGLAERAHRRADDDSRRLRRDRRRRSTSRLPTRRRFHVVSRARHRAAREGRAGRRRRRPGLAGIHRRRGQTFGQDEASCAVFGMPQAAQRLGAVTDLLPPDRVARAIHRAVAEIRV